MTRVTILVPRVLGMHVWYLMVYHYKIPSEKNYFQVVVHNRAHTHKRIVKKGQA